jgi:hypothetical protein
VSSCGSAPPGSDPDVHIPDTKSELVLEECSEIAVLWGRACGCGLNTLGAKVGVAVKQVVGVAMNLWRQGGTCVQEVGGVMLAGASDPLCFVFAPTGMGVFWPAREMGVFLLARDGCVLASKGDGCVPVSKGWDTPSRHT